MQLKNVSACKSHIITVSTISMLTALSVLLVACNGPTLLTSYATDGNSGTVSDDGSVQTIQQNSTISIGDNRSNQGVRGFLDFDISQLPDDASIESATLYLPISQQGPEGDFFIALNGLSIQQFYYDTLEESDFAAGGDFPSPPPDPFLTSVEQNAVQAGNVTDVDIQQAVEYHQANRETLGDALQFRLYAPRNSDDDGEVDAVSILGESAEQTDQKPSISISYTTGP